MPIIIKKEWEEAFKTEPVKFFRTITGGDVPAKTTITRVVKDVQYLQNGVDLNGAGFSALKRLIKGIGKIEGVITLTKIDPSMITYLYGGGEKTVAVDKLLRCLIDVGFHSHGVDKLVVQLKHIRLGNI